MWSRAARAVTADYFQYGNPLRAAAELGHKPDISHLFSQPLADEYLAGQRKFSAANPWFSAKRLDGVTHFPALEIPDATAAEIESSSGKPNPASAPSSDLTPRLVVLLGVVAGEAVFGSRFRVGKHKGKVEEAEFGPWQGLVVSTIHPSAVLRAGDPETRERSYAGLVADLVTAHEAGRRGRS